MTKPTGRRPGRPSNAERAARELAKQRAPGTETLGVKARYDAAGMGRRMRGWKPRNVGPNEALVNLDRIRARSRDSTRNDGTSESIIQKWETNLIGVGIQAREKPTVPQNRKVDRTGLWTRFMKYVDADGVLDGYGMQTLGVRSWFDGGEYFLRKRPRRSDSPLEVPLQVQMLEGEMCPLFDATDQQFMPRGNKIKQGIEFDRSGQRVAYWFLKEHPGDSMSGLGTVADPTQMVRVPASEVRHVFMPKRIGQIRGVPAGAAILAKLRSVLDYDDATLERQKLANLFVAFIKRQYPDGLDPGVDPATGAKIETDLDDKPLLPMEPGMIQELDDGESMEFSNPPEAGTTYSDYMRTQKMDLASGAGLPYELMSGDILNISDRTLRIVIQEFRRLCEQRQWQVVIPMHCQTIRDWFVETAALAGLIAVSHVNEAKDVTWVPHGWQYIHPVQDAQGKALEVKNGVRSRSSWITERGDDPEQVDAERAADRERQETLGLPIAEDADSAADAAQQEEQTSQANARAKREQMLVEGNLSFMAAQTAFMQREAPAPQMHINVEAPIVNLAPAAVQVDNHIEPTPVSVAAPQVSIEPAKVVVENRIEPTPVSIENRVEPTPVTIQNHVEAKAGDVTTVKVELPTRVTESDITRNQDGEITKVKQTETSKED